MPEEHVVKAALALGGDVLADDVRLARGDALLRLFQRDVQAVLVILEGFALRFGGLAGLVKAFFGAEAGIRRALFDQLPGVFLIDGLAVALDVGAVIAADVRAFVIGQAGQVHGLVDHVHRAGNLALLVGILDAEDELAAVAAGVEVRVQRRAQAAQVQVTGRAGGETGADFLHGEILL